MPDETSSQVEDSAEASVGLEWPAGLWTKFATTSLLLLACVFFIHIKDDFGPILAMTTAPLLATSVYVFVRDTWRYFRRIDQ